MTSKFGSLMRVCCLAAVSAAVVIFVGTGCDNNNNKKSTTTPASTNKTTTTKSSDVHSAVGQWAMVNQTDGGHTYWQFNADGSFTMYNDAGYSSAHLGGSYTQNGNNISGNFDNGSTGNGDLGGTTLSSDGNSMVLHFNEHWGSHKVYLLNGTRK